MGMKFKSEAFEAIHSSAAGMYRAGTIDKATMRDFDEACLVAPPIEPEQIKRIRESQRVSQPSSRGISTPASPLSRSGRRARSGRTAWR
jgi:putative transcriptional regulator